MSPSQIGDDGDSNLMGSPGPGSPQYPDHLRPAGQLPTGAAARRNANSACAALFLVAPTMLQPASSSFAQGAGSAARGVLEMAAGNSATSAGSGFFGRTAAAAGTGATSSAEVGRRSSALAGAAIGAIGRVIGDFISGASVPRLRHCGSSNEMQPAGPWW